MHMYRNSGCPAGQVRKNPSHQSENCRLCNRPVCLCAGLDEEPEGLVVRNEDSGEASLVCFECLDHRADEVHSLLYGSH